MYLSDDRLVFGGVGLRVWDLAADTWTLIDPSNPLAVKLAQSPDGRHLAQVEKTESLDWPREGLRLYDATTWAKMPPPADGVNSTEGVAFNPDGRLLATGHLVRVGEPGRSLGAWGHYATHESDYVVRLREMPSGGRFARSRAGSRGYGSWPSARMARRWWGRPAPGCGCGTWRPTGRLPCTSAAPSTSRGWRSRPTAGTCLTVSNDETVRVWDARSWAELTTIQWTIGGLINLAVSPDGLRAAAGSDAGKVVVWDLDV